MSSVHDNVKADASFEEALTRNLRRLRVPWLAAALGVLAILTALVLIWRQYESAKDEAASQLEARAILAATVFDTYFTGQINVLNAIASSPAVVSGDTAAMTSYFARFRPRKGATFPAGVGWIDVDGVQRATSDRGGPIASNLKSRSYVSEVLATGKPFVSEAIVGRSTARRLVVISVPTRDARGRRTGVLAGGILLMQSDSDSRASELGYTGLEVIDREGQQITRRDLARPGNAALVAEAREAKEGVLVDTRGLDGSEGRVVAYAFSATPEWTTVLDQPTSTVFAKARGTFLREMLLLGAGALIALLVIGWGVVRTRRDVRSGRARFVRWAELTRALNGAVDAAEVLDVLAASLAREFPEATVAAVFDVQPDGRLSAVSRGRRSSVTEVDDLARSWILDVSTATGSPVDLRSRSELEAQAGERAPRGASSFYAVGFPAENDAPAGAAALFFTSQDILAAHEAALVQAVVDQGGQALARVRRHQQEHDLAVVLQQSLLPTELPAVDGIEVSAFYRAGVANTSVGGDWYDMVRRPDGIVHFCIGDVAGRGIDAAVAMGQLRNAFRAYAFDNVSPAEIVRRVERHLVADGMATMVCVAYDPYTGELRYACAGHLPPLLVDSVADTATYLPLGNGAPLGWLRPEGPEEMTADVAPGTTLVLYTDGLVERRDVSLDRRMETLGSSVCDVLNTSSADVAREIAARMVESRTEDDLAILVIQLHEISSVLDLELPADLHLARELRHRFGAWLRQRGLDEEARATALLAMHEACVNAMEHAYPETSGTVFVHAEHRDETLSIRVSDNGTWREPMAESDRGRGFVLMKGLMDTASIVQRPDGTDVLLEQRL